MIVLLFYKMNPFPDIMISAVEMWISQFYVGNNVEISTRIYPCQRAVRQYVGILMCSRNLYGVAEFKFLGITSWIIMFLNMYFTNSSCLHRFCGGSFPRNLTAESRNLDCVLHLPVVFYTGGYVLTLAITGTIDAFCGEKCNLFPTCGKSVGNEFSQKNSNSKAA